MKSINQLLEKIQFSKSATTKTQNLKNKKLKVNQDQIQDQEVKVDLPNDEALEIQTLAKSEKLAKSKTHTYRELDDEQSIFMFQAPLQKLMVPKTANQTDAELRQLIKDGFLETVGADEDTVNAVAVVEKDSFWGLYGWWALGLLTAGGIAAALLLKKDEETDPVTPATTIPLTAAINATGTKVSGEATPGSTVSLKLPSGSTLTTVVNTTGTYTLTLTDPVEDGETLTAIATSKTGGTETKILTAPDLKAPAVPTGTIDETGSTITGTSEPKSTITAKLPSGTTLTTVTDSKGGYTFKVEPSLTGGEQVEVTAKDPGGISNPATVSRRSIKIEKITDDTGVSATDNVTYDTSLVVSGTLGEKLNTGEKAQISGDGGKTWTDLVVGTNLAWSYSDPRTLTQGDVVYKARIVDSAGAAILNAEKIVRVITNGPSDLTTSVSIGDISQDNIVNAQESLSPVTVQGKVDGTFNTGDVISIRRDSDNAVLGTAKVDVNGVWSTTIPGASVGSQGAHELVATLVTSDVAGNTGTISGKKTYTVDTQQPVGTVIDVTAITQDNTINLAESTASQTVSGTVSGDFLAGDLVTVTVGTNTYTTAVAANGTWRVNTTGQILSTISPKSVFAQVVAHDVAGNSVVATKTHSYLVDLVVPNASRTQIGMEPVTTDNILNSTESGQTIPLAGTVSGEYVAGDKLSVVVNNTTYTTTVGASGNWEVSVPGAQLKADPDHKVSVTVTATDEAGNTGNISSEFEYGVNSGTSAIGLIINDVTADNVVNMAEAASAVTITGTATGTFKSGDVVTVTLSGQVYSATLNSAGAWSVSVPPSALGTTGSYKIQATVASKDSAGNALNGSASHNFTVDKTAPNSDTVDIKIDAIAADDVLDSIEMKKTIAVTGQVNGQDFKVGDQVVVKVGTQSYLTTVTSDPSGLAKGVFEVQVPGSVLKDNTQVVASIVATDVSGNTGTVSDIRNYVIDRSSEPLNLKVNDTDVDNKPTAYGTAEPASTVTLTWPDGSTSTVMTDPTGNYTFESPKTQNTGTVTATSTNVTGVKSDPVGARYVDTVNPSNPTLLVSETDNDGKPEASGTAEPLSTVTITWPDGSTVTSKVDSEGQYKVEAQKVQKDGTVSVVAIDASNNTSNKVTGPYTDKQAPLKPTLGITDTDEDGRPEGQGTSEPLSTVTLTWPDGSTSTVVTDSLGYYKIEAPTSQKEGTVTATAKDINGNSSEPVNARLGGHTPQTPTIVVTDKDGDGKPEATGSSEPLSTVTIIWPNQSSTTAVTNSSGVYTGEATVVQKSGTVTAIATDSTGTSSAPVTGPYKDTTNPAAPTLLVTEKDNDGMPEASGTSEPFSKVKVTWPDGSTSTTMSDSKGDYTVEAPTVQKTGTVTASAEDLNGNTSAPMTGPYKDTQAPVGPVLTVTEKDGDGKPEATGTAEPKSTVTITWPDGSTSTTLTDSIGNYSVESPKVQKEGTVTATATDVNNNVSKPVTGQYVDGQNPVVPTLAVTDPDENGKPTATGTTEPLSTVTITWPDKSTITVQTDSTGKYTVEALKVQPEGTVTATAKDVNANTSAPIEKPYVDGGNPSTPSVAPTDADNDGKPEATGTADPLTKVTLTWPDGSTTTTMTNSQGKYATEAPTIQKTGTISATATDQNGNTSAPGAAAYLDKQGPLPPTVLITDEDKNGKPEVTGTSEPLSTVTLTWPTGVTSTVAVGTTGTYKVVAPTVQPPGTVTATAKDINENTSPSTEKKYTDNINPEAPTITASDIDKDNKPTASGTAEPFSKVTITWPDGSTSLTTTDSSGNYSVESPTLQNSGFITASAADQAGNTSIQVHTNYDNLNAEVFVTVRAIDDDADNKPTASGLADPLSTVTVTWPDGTTSVTTADNNGKYSVESPTTQNSGTVTAIAKDGLNRVSPVAKAQYADATAPTAPTAVVTDPDKDNKPTTTGTAEPNATVKVTWPDKTTATTTTDSTGKYTIEALTPQTTGTVSVATIDPSGNTSTTLGVPYADVTPPEVPTGTVSDPDKDNKPTVVGTAEPLSTVKIIWPDGSSITAAVNSEGNYGVESLTPQTTGSVTVTAVDQAGNTSAPLPLTYKDVTLPAEPSLIATDPDADNLPDASGTGEPGSTITVQWPDNSTSTTTVDTNGKYKVESLTPQSPGTVTATSVDKAGNSSSKAVALYTDNTPPATPTVAATDPDADDKPTATGTAEANSTVTVTWPDGTKITTKADATGKYSVESILPQTSGTVTALATDIGGNESPLATTQYKDTTAPTAPLVKAHDADLDDKPTAFGSAEPTSTVTVTWPDGTTITTVTDTNGSYSVESLTPQGSGTITAVAKDKAGNTGLKAETPYKDTTAPDVPSIVVTDPDLDGKPTASGTAEPLTTVTVKWPDGSTSLAPVDSLGNYSIESNQMQPNGVVDVMTTDKAGNTSPHARGPYNDLAPPKAPTVSANDPDGDNRPTASGSAEPKSTVTIVWPDGSTSTTVASTTGSYSVESPKTQPTGSVTASTTDAAGNTSAKVDSIYTDLTPPKTPTLTTSDPDGDNKPTATGTAEPNSTVTITWPDGTSDTTKAATDGTYSIESPKVQKSGTVAAIAEDVSGNSSPEVTAPYVDKTAPQAPTVSASDPDNDDKPTATGSAEPKSTVTITWPDGSTSTAVTSSTGSYSVESPKVQPTGTIGAVSTDAANNSSPQAVTKYTDTTPPSAPTVAGSDPDGDNKPTATGTAEPNSMVTITWPDSSTSTTMASSTGNYQIESPKEQTSGTISAQATDASNNSSPIADTKYNDTTVPTQPTVVASDPDGDNKPTASGTAEPLSTVTVTWPDGSTSTAVTSTLGAYSVESLTPQGSGTVSATSKDKAGNTSLPAAAPYKDVTAPSDPTIAASDPDKDDKPTATGTSEPLSTVTIKWPDGSTSTTIATSTGTYSIESPTTQKSGQITAQSKDKAGNTSAVVPTQYVDTTNPEAVTVSASDPDNDDKPTATGTAEPNTTVLVTWPDNTVSTALTNAQGVYVVESPNTQKTGNVTAKSTDASGNTSPLATTVYIDQTPPAQPTALDMTAATDSGTSNTDNVTNDSTPTFAMGTIPQSGEKPSLYIDGQLVPSSYDPVYQTLTPLLPIALGNHVAQTVLTDASGNVSSKSPTLPFTVYSDPTIDITAPIAGDGVISASEVNLPITGTTTNVQAGRTVTVILTDVNGKAITATTTVDATGKWTLPATNVSSLADGPLKVAALTTDAYQNIARDAESASKLANNTAPVNTVPATQASQATVAKQISGLQVSDGDAGSGQVTVTLSAANGVMAVSGGSAAITGSGTGTVTLTGTLAQINDTLTNGKVYYTGNAAFSGTDKITMSTNDNANTGLGGALTDVDTFDVTVAALPKVVVNVTNLQSSGVETESFSTGSGISTSIATGLLVIVGSYISQGETNQSYAPAGGSGTYIILNSDNNQRASGRVTTFNSNAGEFTGISFVYDDLQNFNIATTVNFYNKSGQLISSQSLPFVGNGSGTFNSGTLSQAATYFTITGSGDLWSMDDLTLRTTGLHEIPNGGSTTDSTPRIDGTISRTLVAGETVQVLRDGSVAGTATVTGTTWNYTDTMSLGAHTYTARVMQNGTVQAVSTTSRRVTLVSTPLALDLDGDGIHTLDQDAGVQFDLDASGQTNHVGWIDSHDGLLALDLNGNGAIDSGAELFGEHMIQSDGQKASDGWDALSGYDSNDDDKIDAQDAVWQQVLVWQDANSNGQSDEGELHTLTALGIVSIDLVHGMDETIDNGNIIASTGLFTKENGEQSAIADVYFEIDVEQPTEQPAGEAGCNSWFSDSADFIKQTPPSLPLARGGAKIQFPTCEDNG